MKNEKNRQDEKFDERAKEDSFFAAKEHKLIEGMKTDFRSREAALRAAQMVICPKCSGKFAKYRFMGCDLDRCVSCEGIWLAKGQLAEILRQQTRGPLGAFLDRCFAKDEPTRKGP